MPRTVLYLHSSAGLDGADRQLLALAGGLDGARYRPLVALPERGELVPLLEEAGVEVVVAPMAVLRRRLLSARGAAAILRRWAGDRRRVGRLAAGRGVSLVHSNTTVVLSGHAIARAARAPHLVHVREIYEGAAGTAGRWAWPLQRRRLERADALACVSRATAAQFGPSAPSAVIHDGLVRVPTPAPRETARERLGLDPASFVVALIGRISDWKGQDLLARALATPALTTVGAVGVVAGDAHPGHEDQARVLEALGRRLGVGDRLHLLGFRHDLDTVLGAADAVAVPSKRPDPLPNSALEAAAAGLPVVAAAHGGLPEIVADGSTGRLVVPGDHHALATALRDLADDPEGSRRLGAAAARDVRERFSLPRLLDSVQRLYDALVERPRD